MLIDDKEGVVIQSLGRGIELHSWQENENTYYRRYDTSTEEYEDVVEVPTNAVPRVKHKRRRLTTAIKKR